MARPKGELTRCSGAWTEARYNSFITSMLRGGQWKWAPISETLKEARTKRGFYLCAGCKEEVPTSIRDGRKKVKNVLVDHIDPIVDPAVGFTTWDEKINRMYCEKDNLQVLCKACHDEKTKAERAVAAETRRKKKEQNEKL